jgi:uncharacterized protein
MTKTNWQAIRELAEDLNVLATDVSRSSSDHGPRHWRDVARMGLALWAEGIDIKDDDMVIVLLFAMLHDSQRLNEFSDPDHGDRAAALAGKLASTGGLLDWLDTDRLSRLSIALDSHDRGEVIKPDDDAAIALCWDSDRLTLSRVGITPDPKYLSNPEAMTGVVIGSAYGVVHNDRDFEWERIIECYEELRPLDILNPAVPPQHGRAYRDARRNYGDDLIPQLRLDRGEVITVIRSKYVQDFYMGPAMHAYYNARYLTTAQAAEEALDAGDWTQYILYHEKPYRLDAIYDCIEAGMSPEETAEQLGSAWTHSENIHEQQDEWMDLWNRTRDMGHLEYAMDDEERAKLDALPEIVTVYRGYNRAGRDEGLSWTLKREQAEWFARRWAEASIDEPNRIGPHVTVGTVRRTDILACFVGRGEDEVVILPEDVRVEEHYEVHGPQTHPHQYQPDEAA